MFERLAKSGIVKFWAVRPRRTAPGPNWAVFANQPYSNDNLPGLRRPAATGRRRPPTPALACHWVDRDGRLECRWKVEGGDGAPFAEIGPRRQVSNLAPAVGT